MAHYLFTQWDGGGSLPPELTVVRRLVEAGHTVTVLGEPVTEAEVRAVGVTDFRPWVDAPHHVTRRAEDDYIRDWERADAVRRARQPHGHPDGDSPPRCSPPRRWPSSTTCGPTWSPRASRCFGALLAAEARRVPCAVLVPNVVALPAEGMPPFGTGFLPPKGPLGRLRDRALNGARRSAVEQGPARAEPDARVARPRAARPAAGPVRAGRPGPRAHGRGVRLPRRAARATSATSAPSSTIPSGPSRGPRRPTTTAPSCWWP